MSRVVLSGSFDNLHSREVRLLDEAARLGEVTVLLWPDELIQRLTGLEPHYPQAERIYFLQALRFVKHIEVAHGLENPNALPAMQVEQKPAAWVMEESEDNPARQAYCREAGISHVIIADRSLREFPDVQPEPQDAVKGAARRPKVLVTGCYDWLHSGHVRFFEEASALGDLYVVVGHDENVRLLKGVGHPLFPQEVRRYMAQSIRYVKQALISSGNGWMDAEPEIALVKPDMYVVNEDGDQPEKRAYCEEHGLEYVVLKREPKAGLPRRESTKLRGF
jgi:cytidyltransferase-like protein